MADQLLTAQVDVAAVVAGLERVGQAARGYCLDAALQTAHAVLAGAQSRIAKRRPLTVQHIIFETRRVADGYVVVMDRNAKDVAALSRRRILSMGSALGKTSITQMKRDVKRAESQQKHTGSWLEFGTTHQRPRPFLFPAAAAEEGPYLQRIAAAVDRAVQEAGL